MADPVKICSQDLIIESEGEAQITNVSVAASYNWLDAHTPTILVPGIPPVYTAPRFPPRLSPDTGSRYIDQNGDRNPGSPLESLVVAVHAIDERFDFNSVDIITDRRPLRKLFGFVNGEHGKPQFGLGSSFNFCVEIIGGSAIFTRIEDETREYNPSISGDDSKICSPGYRKEYDSIYTKMASCGEGSTSHHRILKYNFGGLKILVRNAVDAYLADEARKLGNPEDGNEEAEEDLVAYLEALSLDRAAPTTNNAFNKRVTVKNGGRKIPPGALLELVTRKQTTPFEIEDRMPDLWISQTPNFLLCRYWMQWLKRNDPRAVFDDITHIRIDEKLHGWEAAHLETLRKLAVVLKEIVKVAKGVENACFVSFSGEEGAPLIIKGVTGDEERRVPSLSLKTRALFKDAKAPTDSVSEAQSKS